MSKERFEFLEYRFSHGTCTQEEYAEYKQEVERRQNLEQKEYENALLKQENCSHASTSWVSYMYSGANRCDDCGKIV